MCNNTGCNNNNSNCGSTSNCNTCSQQSCGCKFEVDAACVRYTGNALSCIEVNPGETVEQFLKKLNDKFCDIYPAQDGVDGTSAYQLWLDLGNSGTEQDFINDLKGNNLIVSEHPSDLKSTGTALQPIGLSTGYELGSWKDLPNGTLFEIEVDIKYYNSGAAIPGVNLFGFYLTESNTYLGFTNPTTPLIPLSTVSSGISTANAKLSITKKSDGVGYASFQVFSSLLGGTSNLTQTLFSSNSIVIDSTPSNIDTFKVLVKPLDGEISLERILIKKILPAI